MADAKKEEATESKPHPFSGAGISSLIIGLAGVFIKEHPTILQGVVLSAPSIGYGTVEIFKYLKKRQRLKEICDVIDDAINVEESALTVPGLSKPEKETIKAEIRRLRQLKLDHRLGNLEIKSLKE